jgi:cysteine desulfurase
MAIYLDYNATTPMDQRVAAAMQPWLSTRFGNSSSRDHRWGWDAAEAVESARLMLADSLGLKPIQIVFTSSATESLNTVLRAYVGFSGWSRKKLITCATEHPAVLACCHRLARATGVALQVMPVDSQGHVDRADLEAALRNSPGALVALMAANNEIGTLHPIVELARLCHGSEAALVCDLAQAVGKCDSKPIGAAADFTAISAHKFYGPPGAGALTTGPKIGREPEWSPLLIGGKQENGLRAGSANVPGIVGTGMACRIAVENLETDMARLGELRDALEARILAELPDTWINGDRRQRICNTTNLGFVGVDARALIRDMDDIGVSTQAACSTGAPGPSHVLKALGLSDEQAYSCIRVSVGRFTTADEIDHAARKLIASVHKLRRSKSLRM